MGHRPTPTSAATRSCPALPLPGERRAGGIRQVVTAPSRVRGRAWSSRACAGSCCASAPRCGRRTARPSRWSISCWMQVASRPFAVDLADFVLVVEIAQRGSRPGARHRRNARATTGSPRWPWSARPERQTISGLAMRIGCGFSPSRATSTTMTRCATPTCGAARPMPIAWYIVSTMSSISRRTLASTAATGFALILSRGSGAVMIGNRAMWAR